MILVDGDKYACQQCIRGHRSSSCKHIQRPLVLVRSRGRPSTDSSQRIAIFAEEIKDEEERVQILKNENNQKNNLMPARLVTKEKKEDSCCSKIGNSKNHTDIKKEQVQIKELEQARSTKKTTCHCCRGVSTPMGCRKKTPVFVLKAAKRQVYNVEKESLKLLDPVVEIPNSKVGLDIIRQVSKSRKMHSCRDARGNLKKEVIQKIVDDRAHERACCSRPNVPVDNVTKLSLGSNGLFHQFKLPINKNPKVGEGASCCKKEPSRNFMQENIFDNLQENKNRYMTSNLDQLGIDGSSYITSCASEKDNNAASHNSLLYDLYVADNCVVPGSCSCEPESCSCPGCAEHGKYKDSNLSIKQQFEQFPFPTKNASPPDNVIENEQHVKPFGQVAIQPSIPQFEQSFLKFLHDASNNVSINNESDSNSQSTDADECYCQPNECCCFNCIPHGIINGVRISDGELVVESEMPMEIQLLGANFPPVDNSPSSSSISTPNEYGGSDSNGTMKHSMLDSYINEISKNIHPQINPTDKSTWIQNYYQKYINANMASSNESQDQLTGTSYQNQKYQYESNIYTNDKTNNIGREPGNELSLMTSIAQQHRPNSFKDDLQNVPTVKKEGNSEYMMCNSLNYGSTAYSSSTTNSGYGG